MYIIIIKDNRKYYIEGEEKPSISIICFFVFF